MTNITALTSIQPQLQSTHQAAAALGKCQIEQKNAFLAELSAQLLQNTPQIIAENAKDLALMPTDDPKYDRLLLNPSRIQNLADSLQQIAQLPDPTNVLLLEKTLPNGLLLQKKAVALGVIGVIYEARPNVTIDVTAICLKSGNCVILKGGTDAQHSNEYLVSLVKKALQKTGLPSQAVCLLPAGREYVQEMLQATRYIDIIIPRGSQSLIDFVRKNSLVPTIETGAGVCHTYVHEAADLAKAAAIVVNAKTTRVSVCNSLDTILVDKNIAGDFLPKIVADFEKFEVEIFADDTGYQILGAHKYKYLQHADDEDFGREYLSFKCSLKVVENLDEALNHIAAYSSRHSEAIVSEDIMACERFLNEVDAAAVYANASTRFTDGGEFGLGAEIGISTQKLHARGPFAIEKLVTEKWIVRGNGQVR
jgi:glutamate-5-semialdehyde dehydrogenase